MRPDSQDDRVAIQKRDFPSRQAGFPALFNVVYKQQQNLLLRCTRLNDERLEQFQVKDEKPKTPDTRDDGDTNAAPSQPRAVVALELVVNFFHEQRDVISAWRSYATSCLNFHVGPPSLPAAARPLFWH